jgi:RHH-type rel operon transcriptional repressor/antitoxin RelB
MLAIRLEQEIESRLEQLARKTGRTKTYYAREAILKHLEDMEDYYLGVEALQKTGKLYSADEAKRELGL